MLWSARFHANVKRNAFRCCFSVIARQVKVDLSCASLKKALCSLKTNATRLEDRQLTDLAKQLRPLHVNWLTGAGICRNGARSIVFAEF